MTDEHYMQQALKEARKAYAEEEIPIGAVIVMNNKIISRGYNQVEKLNDTTAHAEIIALTSAFNFLGSKYLPDATIYITIEPCLMCAGANVDEKNPPHPGAYLKFKAGWSRGVTAIAAGLSATAIAGSNTFFLFRKNTTEYYIIENRFKQGRDSALPGSGLAIWRVPQPRLRKRNVLGRRGS